jgi:hypothetical protein
MKYFLDTEFIENGITIDLMSIGIVCEDGRTYYAQNHECKFEKASDWVWRNVFPSLTHFNMNGDRGCNQMEKMGHEPLTGKCGDPTCPWRYHWEIRNEVREFMSIEKFGKPEVWGYYADYDWVVFCQLFGTMMELPKGFPMYCRDLKQLCDSKGNPELPKASTCDDHNALSDAIEIKMKY